MNGTGQGLDARLGYRFRNPSLLEAALTHRSAAGANNERLEFLGDGLLNWIVGESLYQSCPQASEGDLTRLRASLVRESTLAEIARELDLGAHLRLGSGELRSGGHRRESILADAVEAVIAAAYLDGGHDAARELVLRLYGERLRSLPDPASLKDAKTRLQEYLQGRGLPLPEYEVLEISGEAHAQSFRVICRLAGENLDSEGQGPSRRQAEQDAAAQLLARLEQH